MEVASLKEIEFLKDLSDYKISLLKEYMNFTLEENKKFNLTSLDSEDEFIVKNILDSLLVVKFLQDDFSNKRIVDIGSGAGLPGIPLAIYYSNTKFYLLEPTTKRANFLKRTIEFLKLENVEVINERAELLARSNFEKFDIATARAVANINILLELAIPLLKIGGTFIAYKGKNYKEEANSIKLALNELKTSSKLVVNCILPYTSEERNFAFFEKKEEISNKYPRNYSLIKKRPL